MTAEHYREYLAMQIKLLAKQVYDMAEDIAGKTDYISDLTITLSFDQGSCPAVSFTRAHLPSREKLEEMERERMNIKLNEATLAKIYHKKEFSNAEN